MGHSLPWTPMNRREKLDAASFILGGEICNRTNKQTNKQTNKHKQQPRYPHLAYWHVWIVKEISR